jgi:hypothetical protein
MCFLGEHLEFDAVHLLKLLGALVGEVDPREVKILGKVLEKFVVKTFWNLERRISSLRKF